MSSETTLLGSTVGGGITSSAISRLSNPTQTAFCLIVFRLGWPNTSWEVILIFSSTLAIGVVSMLWEAWYASAHLYLSRTLLFARLQYSNMCFSSQLFHHHCLSSEMWYQLLMKVYEDIYIFLFEGSSITMDNNMTLSLRYYTYKLITIIHMIPPLVIYWKSTNHASFYWLLNRQLRFL